MRRRDPSARRGSAGASLRRRTSALLTAGLALTLYLGSLPRQARADFKKTYEEGLQAVEAEDWTAVARLMESAIAEEPQENRRVRLYGMRFVPYLPHYYLGLARFRLGDCDGALAAWRSSEEQGEVAATEEYGSLQRLRATCGDRRSQEAPAAPGPDPAALSRASAAARSEIAEGRKAAARLSALEEDPVLAAVWGIEPDLGRRQRQAIRDLEGAASDLDAAEGAADLGDIQEAQGRAARARAELEAVAERAGRRRSELAAAEKDRRQREEEERLARLATRRRNLLDGLAVLADQTRTLLSRMDEAAPGATASPARAELEGLLRELDTAGADPSVARLEALQKGILAASERVRQDLEAALARVPDEVHQPQPTVPPDGPPKELRRAAEAICAGRYQETLDTLSGVSFATARASAHAHLLRAAARHGLFLLGGSEDDSLLRAARQDIRSCRAQDPRLAPDPEIFSPPFIRLFESEG